MTDAPVGTDEVALEITGLAAGGEGVARRDDGKVLFVPRTAPGDRVRVRITKERARWARGAVVEILEPSPERVTAPCPRYDRCGGCALQHLAYPAQLEWKGRFVADALERIGGVPTPAPAVRPSPDEVRYRHRMRYTLRRLRGGRVLAGMHELGAATRVLDVGSECLLPEAELARDWDALRAAWGPGARALPEGGRLRLALAATDEGFSLTVEGGPVGWDGGGLPERLPRLSDLWHRPAGKSAPIRVHGPDPEGGPEGPEFRQANRVAAERLRAHVLQSVGAGARAVDAYAGVGATAEALSAAGWSVTAIEADPLACRVARASGPSFAVVEGLVEECLAAALPADVVVLNPPRTGLAPEVPETLAHDPPARIVYVSCDPATLARDAARLAPGFRLTALDAFDLFPQTPHVEVVAVFEREGDG